MEIVRCILKIYPDWRGVVWENDYKGIKPHVLEKRPIPTMKELEAVWPEVQAEMEREGLAAEAETMIQEKMRTLAVSALVKEGKLTADGKIAKEIVK